MLKDEPIEIRAKLFPFIIVKFWLNRSYKAGYTNSRSFNIIVLFFSIYI